MAVTDAGPGQFHRLREGCGVAGLDDALHGARDGLALTCGCGVPAHHEGDGGDRSSLGAYGFQRAEQLRPGG